MRWCALVLLAGCFSPDFEEGQPCGRDRRCPPSLSCGADQRCRRRPVTALPDLAPAPASEAIRLGLAPLDAPPDLSTANSRYTVRGTVTAVGGRSRGGGFTVEGALGTLLKRGVP